MSGAALAMALALLIAPVSARHRLGDRHRPSGMPARTVMLGCAVVAAVAVILAARPGVLGAAAIIGATVAVRRRRRNRDRRRTAEAAALQGALDVLIGELRVGAHPVTAFDVAAAEVEGVVAVALRTIAARARMGAGVAAGMRSVAGRSSLPAHWDRLAACWELAQTHGLAIASLMQTAQRDLVERERFSVRVAASMAGARATGSVLAVLPVIGIGLGQLIGANPLGFLVGGGAGGWLLVIGVALGCAGLTWSDRITGEVTK
jgi:tight adherence protein B